MAVVRRPSRFSCSIELPGRRVRAECLIWPARLPSHAGPDSPDYLNPGKRAWVDALRIYEAGVDVTETFSPSTLSRIREAVRRASLLPSGSPARHLLSLLEPVSFQHSLQLGERTEDAS
jgi:hypothetical protein